MDNSTTAQGLGSDLQTCCDTLATDLSSLSASLGKAGSSQRPVEKASLVASGFAPYPGAWWMLARPGGPEGTPRDGASLLQVGWQPLAWGARGSSWHPSVPGVTPRLASSQIHRAAATPPVRVSAVRVPLRTLTSNGDFQPPEELLTIQGRPTEGVGSLGTIHRTEAT